MKTVWQLVSRIHASACQRPFPWAFRADRARRGLRDWADVVHYLHRSGAQWFRSRLSPWRQKESPPGWAGRAAASPLLAVVRVVA